MLRDKVVIYKVNGVLYTTTEKNYSARIQNARLIHKMDGFNSPQEIIEYYNKYFGTTADNFIIKERLLC